MQQEDILALFGGRAFECPSGKRCDVCNSIDHLHRNCRKRIGMVNIQEAAQMTPQKDNPVVDDTIAKRVCTKENSGFPKDTTEDYTKMGEGTNNRDGRGMGK